MAKNLTKTFRQRRNIFVVILAIILLILGFNPDFLAEREPFDDSQNDVLSSQFEGTELARDVLETLAVKGRAPKSGYSRSEFGDGWARVESCDMRNIILQRSLSNINLSGNCVVLSGELSDPYTGERISFIRGRTTSDEVQIDHVVALSDAWQKGAQNLDFDNRVEFSNDPLNLLAVSGEANQQKGDSDAASWLPSNKSYRCRYVARQISVKSKYDLWVTEAEKATMKRILNGCGDQRVPIEQT